MKTFKPPRSLTRAFPQVKKVIHATEPVSVRVGKADCKEGRRLLTDDCALARAAKRQMKADGVAIRLSDSFVVKGDTAIRFKTPETVKRELVSFDRHQDFASGTYRLAAAPPNWSKPGRKHSPGGGKVDNRDKHRVVYGNHRTVRVRTTNSEELPEEGE